MPNNSGRFVAPTLTRLAYSPAELADALGASRAWVYLRLDDGTIPSVKLGGKRLIRSTVLDEILAGEVVPSDVA